MYGGGKIDKGFPGHVNPEKMNANTQPFGARNDSLAQTSLQDVDNML